MKYKISYQLSRYPRKCKECPAFNVREYRCCNERGYEGTCALGYFKSHDMREFEGNRLSGYCRIKDAENVTIVKDL